MFDDGTGDANGVAFLECIQSNRVRWHLTSDDHHGNAIHVCGRNTCDGIGGPRARCDQSNTHVARGTGVPVGRMNGSLLVTNKHVLYRVLVVERVVNVENCAAWVTPDVLDIFGL